ncbi:MAG: hypothetical protein H0W02_18985 [Ktedonobacteraceae bacterium]|nr:hypothetical protein [Ktedonobacteraceae bacterium]
MATLEERVTALEDALEHDFGTPLRAMMLKMDEQDRDIRELGRDVREQGRDMREIKSRLATMDSRLGTLDSRVNGIDEKITIFKEEMNVKFDQIVELLTQGRSTP